MGCVILPRDAELHSLWEQVVCRLRHQDDENLYVWSRSKTDRFSCLRGECGWLVQCEVGYYQWETADNCENTKSETSLQVVQVGEETMDQHSKFRWSSASLRLNLSRGKRFRSQVFEPTSSTDKFKERICCLCGRWKIRVRNLFVFRSRRMGTRCPLPVLKDWFRTEIDWFISPSWGETTSSSLYVMQLVLQKILQCPYF